MIPVWILATLAAAAVQTLRFLLQKRLRSAGLSTAGATFSRFVFAAPLAIGLVTLLVHLTGQQLAQMPPRFWIYGFVGGLGQIFGTFFTVSLFSQRNFAVGIAFTKTETVQVALFSAVVLGEAVSGLAFVAILIGLAGVIALSLPKGAKIEGLLNRATAMGLFAGAAFGVSAIGYRGASLSLSEGGFVFRAAMTLAAVTTMQTIVMAIWLRFREPGELGRVVKSWRATSLVGLTGMLGSLGWFIAFTLQNAAFVRALGQIELIFSMMVSVLVLREAVTRREVGGMALLGASILLLIFAAQAG